MHVTNQFYQTVPCKGYHDGSCIINHNYFCFTEGDPKNYIPYYRRATVYLAMGKSKSALPDLDKVIDLKPDFIAVSFKFNLSREELNLINQKC